ncbi:hypothetical protein EQG49_11115 [Periweissella cryptocerci]|uniref:Uncharacterized protein n=1 Tax=Periweissella cryptocerci TaxID=2506420 RepID=A0A4P6YW08_9LACO|nr:hypothetical protein [Periweissella cryptocerci]QBO36956.1 hypothetical protein EQG49_11115 [Periweissella cryptocerci]
MKKSEVEKYAKLLVSILFERNSNLDNLNEFIYNSSDETLDKELVDDMIDYLVNRTADAAEAILAEAEDGRNAD